jgi:hypothetical protein
MKSVRALLKSIPSQLSSHTFHYLIPLNNTVTIFDGYLAFLSLGVYCHFSHSVPSVGNYYLPPIKTSEE